MRNKGFTFVELMLVVFIIGILVAIAVPVYSGLQVKAVTNACLENQMIIHSVAVNYYKNNGYYPPNVQELFDEGYLQNVTLKCGGVPYGDINVYGFVECPTGEHTFP